MLLMVRVVNCSHFPLTIRQRPLIMLPDVDMVLLSYFSAKYQIEVGDFAPSLCDHLAIEEKL